MGRRIKLIIFLQILFLLINRNIQAETNRENLEAFKILPWEVGQYAVYQVVSIENESIHNRYKFSLVDKEEINGKAYFWLEITIFEGTYDRFEKTVEFKALVPPLTTEEFIKNPEEFIKRGLFPYGALKLFVQFESNPTYKLNLESIYSSQNIIRESDYSLTPDALGEINFNNMKIADNPEKIYANFGKINCYRFFVDTSPEKEFYDEGFEVWRSPTVPFLGIVKMEFSKTLYWEKYNEKNKFKSFFQYLFSKIVPGRQRPDIHTINLIAYGNEK